MRKEWWVVDQRDAAYGCAIMTVWMVREAGRLGAAATNKKLSKKRRKENALKAALARWVRR
jgi:hypothetical protein